MIDSEQELYDLKERVQKLEATVDKSNFSAGLADNKAETRRLRYAIERLGSMEAFTMPRMVDKESDAELMARIDYARQVLAG